MIDISSLYVCIPCSLQASWTRWPLGVLPSPNDSMTHMRSDCCGVPATLSSHSTETHWPPIASYSLDTRVSGFIQMSSWMKFLLQFFFISEKKTKSFLVTDVQKALPLPLYLCSHTHAPQPAGSQADQTGKALVGERNQLQLFGILSSITLHTLSQSQHI